MLRKVTLYGDLGAKFGKHWMLDVKTPGEAVRAIEANIPGFYDYLSEVGRCFHIIKGTKYDSEELDLGGISSPIGNSELKIIPVVYGAKSGFMKFVVGALMVVAVIYTAGLAAGAGGMGFGTTMSAGMTSLTGGGLLSAEGIAIMDIDAASSLQVGLAKIGMGIAISGIAQMLAPKPSPPSSSSPVDNGSSYNFNGSVNTTAQGVPVPVCYGRLIVGSAVISAGIKSEDIGFVEEEAPA